MEIFCNYKLINLMCESIFQVREGQVSYCIDRIAAESLIESLLFLLIS